MARRPSTLCCRLPRPSRCRAMSAMPRVPASGFPPSPQFRRSASPPSRGATVLIAGGAGSVAHYAIQLSKLRGATVVTTVSSEKAARARRGGADHVINYKTANVPECILAITYGRGVDAVIELDLSSNARLYPSLLRPHATVIVYGMAANETTLPSLWLMQNSIALRLFLIYDISEADRSAGIAELTPLLAEGRLVHSVARRLPLVRSPTRTRSWSVVKSSATWCSIFLRNSWQEVDRRLLRPVYDRQTPSQRSVARPATAESGHG
jgi:NADPH:quinone reductase-like Zn-dependent oxidoreductase